MSVSTPLIETAVHEPAEPPLLVVQDLVIHAEVDGSRRTIVDGLNLTLEPGETVGIVGESGSGKSMTARALVGLTPPGVTADGTVELDGRQLIGLDESAIAPLRGSEIALVLQDPFTMLDPLMPCGRQIEESLRRGRTRRELPRAERRARVANALEEVGITDPAVAERYPFQLSGGMCQRVALAAALARNPRVLIADEPTTGLDVTTQRRILELVRELQAARGMALILITHDLGVAFSTCDRINVLYAGSLLESGPTSSISRMPQHPYTLALLLAEPSIAGRTADLYSVPGSVPTPDEVHDRCPFEPRCSFATDRCRIGAPPLVEVTDGHASACVRINELDGELTALRAEISHFVPDAEGEEHDEVLRVENLNKVFRQRARGRTNEVSALEKVSICVGKGETVGVVGESGSGKTTLGRCLVGLETPDAGTIVVDGMRVERFQTLRKRDRRSARATAQMVFQDPYSSLNPALTIGGTLREIVKAHDAHDGDADATTASLLEQVGLSPRHAKRKPAALSGGERQRVAIARALAVRPRLIVLDEAVSALDVSVQAQILALLRRLREELGLSFLFITHDLAVVRQMADRVYVMHHGRVVEEGTAAQVIDDPQDSYTKVLRESVLHASLSDNQQPQGDS